MDIENKLKKLFDYQKFENNKELERIVDEVYAGANMLSDEDLTNVNAAGDSFMPNENKGTVGKTSL